MKKRIKSLAASFRAAGKGVMWTIRNERNMRIHMTVAAYVVLFGFMGRVESVCWAIFFLCFAAVISAELVNTALERMCDMVEPGFSRGIAVIKDLASGAVLVAALCSAAAGLCIFLSPRVFGNILNILTATLWAPATIALSIIPALVFIFKKRG